MGSDRAEYVFSVRDGVWWLIWCYVGFLVADYHSDRIESDCSTLDFVGDSGLLFKLFDVFVKASNSLFEVCFNSVRISRLFDRLSNEGWGNPIFVRDLWWWENSISIVSRPGSTIRI